MKNSEKCFIMFLGVAAALVAGVIYENTLVVLHPPAAPIVINVEEVRMKIRQAGLTPREGMHWKEAP